MHDLRAVVELNYLTNIIPAGLVVLDEHSTILSASGRMCDIAGYEEDELLGKNIDELIPDETPNPHQESLKHYVRNGKDPKPMKRLSDVPLQTKKGSILRVDVERYIYRTADGDLRFGGAVRVL